MIKFKCSSCPQEYRVADEYAGKKVRCKSCNAVNTIPAAAPKRSCGDSVAAFNMLLQELLQYEKQAPSVDAEAS